MRTRWMVAMALGVMACGGSVLGQESGAAAAESTTVTVRGRVVNKVTGRADWTCAGDHGGG